MAAIEPTMRSPRPRRMSACGMTEDFHKPSSSDLSLVKRRITFGVNS